MNEEFEIRSSSSDVLLRARLVSPEQVQPPFPVVIMLTGDGPKGTKSQSWTNLPPLLVPHGIASFLFDFQGLGYSEGDRRALSLTTGIENLITAFAFLRQQAWADPDRLGALGSSFGATTLLLSPQVANTLRAIGLKSPASFLPDAYLSEVGFHQFDEWATTGFLEANGYDFTVLLDALKYNVYASAMAIHTPCLITHGDRDEIVSVIQSKYLSKCLRGETCLEVFHGVGHGYSEEGAWDEMARVFVDWFSEQLLLDGAGGRR